jgi:hypothetical protein
MNPEELLAKAQKALAAGKDAAAVDAAIASRTGGVYASVAALQAAMAPKPAPKAKDSRAGVIQAFARNLTRVPFADDIVGTVEGMVRPGMTMQEGRDKQRATDQRLQSQHPLASAAGSIAQAFVPGTVAVKAAQGGRKAVAAGIGLGALGGGAMALDDAEGSLPERVSNASGNMIGGAVVGGLTGAAGAKLADVIPRLFGSPNQRVAKQLVEKTGLPADIRPVRAAASKGVRDVREQFYKPLEQAFPQIDDADVLRVVTDPDVARLLPSSLRSAVGTPGAVSVPIGYGDIAGKGKLLDKMRKAAKTDQAMATRLEEMEAALTKAIPGHDQANNAYAAAMSVKRAIDEGAKTKGLEKSAVLIEEALAAVPDHAKDDFRAQQMHEILRRITERDEDASRLLKRMMDAGSSTREQLAPLFKDVGKLDEFIDILRKERNAAKLASALKARWWIPVAGASGGAVGVGAYQIFK